MAYLPVKGTVLDVRVKDSLTAQTKSNLTISVTPVAQAAFSEHEETIGYCADMAVEVCRKQLNKVDIGPMSVTWELDNSPGNPNVAYGCAPLVDLVIVLGIKNDTTHSLELGATLGSSGAVMQIETADGKVFEPLTGRDRCVGSTITSPTKENPNVWPGSVRVLPGRHRDATAAFCFGRTQPKFPLNLLIFDVPVEADAAGVVTKRENFAFKLEGRQISRFLAFGPTGAAVWSTSPPRCIDMAPSVAYSTLYDVPFEDEETVSTSSDSGTSQTPRQESAPENAVPMSFWPGDGDSLIAASTLVPQWVGKTVHLEMNDGTMVDGELKMTNGLILVVVAADGPKTVSLVDAKRVDLRE